MDDLRHNLVPSTVSCILFLHQNKELIKDWMDLKTVLKGGVDMSGHLRCTSTPIMIRMCISLDSILLCLLLYCSVCLALCMFLSKVSKVLLHNTKFMYKCVCVCVCVCVWCDCMHLCMCVLIMTYYPKLLPMIIKTQVPCHWNCICYLQHWVPTCFW